MILSSQATASPKKQTGNPPAFRATGKGLNVTRPNFPATQQNANAQLVQTLTQQDLATEKINSSTAYLFVDYIQTGWTVSGTTVQTRMSRSWYPQYLSQNLITIAGTMANQYEFDKLVQFVQYHQNTILKNIMNIIGGQTGLLNDTNAIQAAALDFQLLPLNGPNTFGMIPHSIPGVPNTGPIHYALTIEDIQAGHKQYEFAPSFSLSCRVLNDYRTQNQGLQSEILQKMDYGQIFWDGNGLAPSTPTTANPAPINIPQSVSGTVTLPGAVAADLTTILSGF